MSIAVTAPANPVLSAPLTVDQVTEFANLVSGVPAGKILRALVVQVQPNGTGRIQIQIQDPAAVKVVAPVSVVA